MTTSVTRVHHSEYGSHIEPPLDQTWTSLKKLEWHAAVVAYDTGLRISIDRAEYHWGPIPWTRYNVSVGSSVCGPLTFADAWAYLNGVDTGMQATRP